MNKKNLKLLYRSFDEQLDDAERGQLTRALVESKQLYEVKLQLEMLRDEISQIPRPLSRPFLAERVLRKINMHDETSGLEERLWESLFYTFRRAAIATALSVIIVLGIYLANQGIVFADDEVHVEDILETDSYIVME